jgi:hypothetical protein
MDVILFLVVVIARNFQNPYRTQTILFQMNLELDTRKRRQSYY